MSDEERKPDSLKDSGEEQSPVSRRQFLVGAGAGLVVGAAGAAGVLIANTPQPTAPTPVQPPVTQAQPTPTTAPTAAPQVAVVNELLRKKVMKMTINGQPFEDEIDVRWTLKDLLRERLNLTGTKTGCNVGTCGFCTVLVNDLTVYACSVLAASLDNAKVLTIEGLATGDKLHPIQQAYWDNMGFQCAMCTPGFIMTTVAFLKRNPDPTPAQAREAVAGNLCRCGSYPKVFLSVMDAAKRMKGA